LAAHREVRRHFFGVRAIFPRRQFDKGTMMGFVAWLLRIAVFLLLLSFALKNNDPVTLRYYFGYEWPKTQVVALLVFFALGMLFGVLAMLQPWFRARRELARSEGALRAARQAAAEETRPEPDSEK